MSRPSNLQIQGSVVRQLREQIGLSQAELVARVYRALPDGVHRHIPDRNVLERQCYEWEEGNNISRPRLVALSTVLGVPAERLQAPPNPTPSRIDEIAQCLKAQCAGGNQQAIQLLADVGECIHLGAIPLQEDKEDRFLIAAEAIEVRLGGVQLTGGRVELEELGAITGWSHYELLKPACVHAYWLVASESRLGGATELVRGLIGAMAVIKQEVESWFHACDGDSRASLEDEAPWLRIHLQNPDRPSFDKTISVVRCEPHKTGLTFSTPTPDEHWQLTVQNALYLRSTFNFVRPVDDESPWPRYAEMAFELWDVSEHLEDGDLIFLARFSGSLNERALDTLPRLVEERHQMVMSWLTVDLVEHLKPHLEGWSRECWNISAASELATVSLNVPFEIAKYKEPSTKQRTKFALQLVQIQLDGSSKPIPLARASMQVVLNRVRDVVAELPLDSEIVGPRLPVWQRHS